MKNGDGLDRIPSLNLIMVVGVNTRPIAKSAKLLGLKTIAVDCFDDIDLRGCVDELYSAKSLGREAVPQMSSLLELSLRALENHDVDAILLTSGTEHDPKFISELGKEAEIIGNKATHVQTCENKEKLFGIADRLGIPHPLTKRVRGLEDSIRAAENIGYPVVLKPSFGAGGRGIRLARSPEEVERFFGEVLSMGDRQTLYVQEYIKGVDASASILSDGSEAKCLTVNEQVIGDERLGVSEPFGYCGNVLPLRHELAGKVAEYSESLCAEIGLVGSNGVDFVLSDRPYLMEVNPRFQNTIDCVEGLLGINLVEEHIRSCKGQLGNYGRPKGYSAKLILYAGEDVRVPDLTEIGDIVDIPPEGPIAKGHPICSVLKFGADREETIREAYSTARRVQKRLHLNFPIRHD